VHFYRVYTAMEGNAVIPFSGAGLCVAIRELEQSANPYWDPLGDGEVEICTYLENSGDTDRFALAKIRRHSRPLTEAAMIRGPLALQAGVGLCDPIHIRLFPNNIIG
jgi:hypothetical protein